MNDDTEIIWRNLVAYEHAHGSKNLDFIQFLDFMDRLIDSAEDVRSRDHILKLITMNELTELLIASHCLIMCFVSKLQI